VKRASEKSVRKSPPELLLVGMLALLGGSCFGQDYADPRFVLFGGAGVTTGPQVGGLQYGASFEVAPPVRHGQFPFGFLLEGGYIGPLNSLRSPSSGAALFSANYLVAFHRKFKSIDALPFVTGGYTRLFGTGNAVNYGGGVDLVVKPNRAVRFEVKDYLRLSGPKEHDVALRIGWVIYLVY
jgi:hypothetical protein